VKKGPFARVLLCGLVSACIVIAPSAASAYNFPRPLQEGDSGKDVRAFQVRIAGWYAAPRDHLRIDGVFGPSTTEAVVAFETFHGLAADGIADEEVYEVLDSLTDGDGSTAHFDFDEFTQNTNQACSAKANAYAGTFGGGMVAPRRALSNVKRLMWRLEAVRAKAGSKPVGINSGFRSIAYNDCIGGARASQHLYGTAADNRIAERTNHRARRLARHSQIHGIGCYSRLPHNHFDLRMDNDDLPSSQFWWWPERDDAGRELDEAGVPCWGERTRTQPAAPAGLLAAILGAVPGAGSLVPSVGEIGAFEAAGEVPDLGSAD
jgi:zinc D-Ala-D-Ala carboxypeptidase